MFEQTFNNIDGVLRQEAGCTTELDYTEQTSWMLFLKYLDDLEQERVMEAKLVGKTYEFIIDKAHRWSSWAAPKKSDGSFDHDKALTGDDLIDYVNRKLFPYLQGFKQRATGPDTIEYKIGEIFGEIKNKFQSGYSLRDALELMDALRFRSQKEKHELSHLYEAKIKNMGNAGRNGGEYYTPRPLIRAMIHVVKPKIGERIYDGAVGSAGFLCEAYDYLRRGRLTTSKLKKLQTKTFYGKEKKSLAYVIAIMNMILHGIDTPNIIHTNSLSENLADIQQKDRYDVILANPPFGGKERKEVQQNFPIKTSETAFLFLQHFIKYLKAGGKGAVVIKNTFLSNSDNAAKALRQELLENCNLHTVLDCPGGTFLGAGVKTVVLFFDKGAPTRKVWYYQLDPGRNMGKTNALNDDDLKEFVELQANFANSEKSWSVDIKDVDPETFDLSVKNPNAPEETPLREPEEIIAEMVALDAESVEILKSIRGDTIREGWALSKLGDVCKVIAGQSPKGSFYNKVGDGLPFYQGKKDFGEKFIGAPRTWTTHITKEAHDGDILMSVRAPVGPINFATEKVCIGRGLAAIRTMKMLDRNFLFYVLLSKQDEISGNEGAVFASINKKQIESIELAFPPLPEQKRIVAILDEAFKGIGRAVTNAEKNLVNVSELFHGALDASVRGILTKEARSTNNTLQENAHRDLATIHENIANVERKASRKSEDTVGTSDLSNAIPKEWELTTIDSIFNLIDYRGKNPPKSEHGKRLITAKNIRMGFISDEPRTYISEETYKKWMVRGYPSPGDIFFVTEGHTMGYVAFNDRRDEFALAQRTITLQPAFPIPTKFFFYYMMSSFFQELVKKNATGAAAVGIKASKFRNLPLPFPSLKEQEAIIRILDDINSKAKRLESIYEQKLAALAELKQSILQKAFAGELTAKPEIAIKEGAIA